MALNTSKPAMQIIGNYDLVEKVAEGGMGSVWRARHRETGQIVAIKIMPAHMASNPTLLKRFEQEFRAASRLDHPNIVRAIDYGDTGSTPYLVMEFVEGESLGQKIEREGRMPEAEAIRIIAQVAQGLHRAHKQGIIHRDVKPDNVMVQPDGVAKLADLGLVKEVDADLNLTKTGRGLGTPHFMAPEQFRSAKDADIRADIYSLGATLYMMVTGELPFKSNGPLDAWMKKMNNDLVPPRQLAPDLTERTDWAIRRAMSPTKEQRPSSCREFVEDLTGHSTKRVATPDSTTPDQDLWYLVYKDEEGAMHTVKGSTSAIRRSLKDGLLGDASNIRASRAKTGPFEQLRSYPEFRDMIVTPMPASVPSLGNSSVVNAIPVSTGTTLPRRVPTPGPATPSPGNASQAAPHIDLGSEKNPASIEWLKWVLLGLVAVLSAAVSMLLFARK
jgi:eukaryotic-like serine/threonine-protein kinase